jgi:hypothetical protein
MEIKKVERNLKCCYGISSVADESGGHVVYCDYDNKTIGCVKEHIQHMQREYMLGDFYLIKSTNGFNAVCLDVLPLAIVKLIGCEVVSPCDRDFYKYGFKRGYYVLRFDCDKELIEIVPSVHMMNKKSLAHRNFLNWFFGIEIPLDFLFNDFTKINIVQYPSDKNGYHLVKKDVPRYMVAGLSK